MTERRWAWAEIDLGAIRENVAELRSLVGSSTLFMAVVKADGYGHGAVHVARAALEAGADRLGVATVEEAIVLREAGVTAPIQVLSEPPDSSVEEIVDHRIIPTVTTLEFAGALARAAVLRGVEAAVHLKVDTGMNRIGVKAEEAPAFAKAMTAFPGLRLEGTFTHFATADVPGDWDFVAQFERFRRTIEAMRTERIDPGIVHAANSAATILEPASHFSMVRCGIALYGLHPSEFTRSRIRLRPAMSVKARAMLVKRIGLGEGVSYGLTWRAPSPTQIATLPLGYADGVHRVLSNRMSVLAAGKRHPQVGRVCMDQLMVDVGDAPLARGDEFVLVGEQDGETILLDELAELAGTINYEMACAFGMRLERLYR